MLRRQRDLRRQTDEVCGYTSDVARAAGALSRLCHRAISRYRRRWSDRMSPVGQGPVGTSVLAPGGSLNGFQRVSTSMVTGTRFVMMS
jgi:hypothetical protein